MSVEESTLWSLNLEMSALAAMMLDLSAATHLVGILKPGDFYRPSHRHIFRALITLADRGAIDPILLKEELEAKGLLEECGGDDYLISILELLPSAANSEHYAKGVLDKAMLRNAVHECQKVIHKCHEEDASIEDIKALLSSMGEFVRGTTGIQSFGEVPIEGDDPGHPTFIPALNNLIATHGWPSEQMSVVEAYHKGGKTSYLLTDFLEAAENGENVLYATFADLSAKQLKRRLVKMLCGWKKRPNFEGECQKAFDAAIFNVDSCWDAWVYDASAMEDSDIESFCGWAISEHKKKPYSRIYVDYAQELTSRKCSPSDEYGTAALCSKALVGLARKTEAAVIVGSQITQGNEKAGTKTTSKGSRKWEEKGGWILLLERDGMDVTVKIPYSRFGDCGEGVQVSCKWDRERLRFVP